mgnify:FL=1
MLLRIAIEFIRWYVSYTINYQTDLSVSTFAVRRYRVYCVSKKPLKRFCIFNVTYIPRINSGAVLIK